MKKVPLGDAAAESAELRVSYDLRETSRLLLNVLRMRLEPHNISLTQYFLLRQVWGAEGISQSTLTERLGTSQPATVATVDSLELRGLIRRVRSTQDRRVVRLMITPRGHKMRNTLLGYAQEMAESALVGMTSTDIAKLRTLLNQVQSNLERELIRLNDVRERGA